MTMDNKKITIILIPYPAQGHVTPMLKLASLFSTSFNLHPILITPTFIYNRISPQINPKDAVQCIPIPDGLEDDAPRDFFAIEKAMEEKMPSSLEQMIRKINMDYCCDIEGGRNNSVACLVVDLLASWAVDVARRCGVPVVAGFWPAMHATYRVIEAIPRLVRDEIISRDGCPRNPAAPIKLSPNDPTLTANELPWLIGSPTSIKSRFRFWCRTLQRTKTLKWILTNTFITDGSHHQRSTTEQNDLIINDDTIQLPTQQVLEIGSLIMRTPMTSCASFWAEDASFLGWLDGQRLGSVVYVSFGSWASPNCEAQIKNLALALEACGVPFIWALGPNWLNGLPHGYVDRVSRRGKIVTWAPQTEVLGHASVGCFLTHCGWNSTVEAVHCKKPMLCYPIAGDQSLNCAYIVNAWKIGVKLEGFEVDEVKSGIKNILEDQGVISRRVEELNEKMFGKEESSKAASNLSRFIQGLTSEDR